MSLKKVILFFFISTVCAMVMYAIGLTNSNVADLVFAVGCVAYGIPLCGVFMCILLGGINSNSVFENFLFSWLLVAATATIQYIIMFKLTVNYSQFLYYNILVSLICGASLILIGEYCRRELHRMNRY